MSTIPIPPTTQQQQQQQQQIPPQHHPHIHSQPHPHDAVPPPPAHQPHQPHPHPHTQPQPHMNCHRLPGQPITQSTIPPPQPPIPTPSPPPPTTALPIPLLNPPELFSTLHPDIYRCTALDLTSRDFLKTLSLRTILTLAIEKPRPPLRHLSTALSISLIHSPIWLTTTSAASSSGEGSSSSESEPAWRQAVDEAMGYLRPEFRPVLVVDAGGIFCGVVRRVLMGWNVTATVLEYRSFFMGGGTGGRYGSEEVVEMVGGEGWEVPEGLEDLVPKKRVFGEIKEEGEREEEEEEEES